MRPETETVTLSLTVGIFVNKMVLSKEKIKRNIRFLKDNRNIFYSVILVFAVPVILFFSSYYNLIQFEKNFNHLVQSKGVLLQKVFIASLSKEETDFVEIQEKIYRIAVENKDVHELKIVKIDEGGKGNQIMASSNRSEIGKLSKDKKELLAIANSEGIAGITTADGVRFWELVKKVQLNNGENVIIKASISLYEIDQAFQQSINRTYLMIILASLILILLVTNYVRLNEYVSMYKKIKEVDQMKDDFVSMASHELKTPLTAINGYLDLLESSKRKLTKEEQHYLDNIETSSTRLKGLVDDILEVSRIEQGRISFEYSNVCAVEISAKVVDMLLPKAESKGLKLILRNELAPEKAMVKVDPSRLQQIMINLVGNSIKYTEKGSVEVVIGRNNDKIRIAVRDTGIGMSPPEVDSIFKKFNRVKNDKTANIEGTGLGLWITKELVDQMKGEIIVRSAKGKGSCFYVVFKDLSAGMVAPLK